MNKDIATLGNTLDLLYSLQNYFASWCFKIQIYNVKVMFLVSAIQNHGIHDIMGFKLL